MIWLGERHNPFTRNRHHFSYRLLENGLTPPQAVRAIILVTVGSGLGALLLHRVDTLGALVVVRQSACLIGVVALLEFAAIRRQRPAMGTPGPRRRRSATFQRLSPHPPGARPGESAVSLGTPASHRFELMEVPRGPTRNWAARRDSPSAGSRK